MMVLQVIPDRFTAAEAREKAAAESLNGRGGISQRGVRRPVRGIQVKEDTFASIRVVASGSDGRALPLIDAGSQDKKYANRRSEVYSNFLLQAVQEERMEKQQILETFGEPYIFLFGERARVMTFQGVLLNTEDFNWEAEWWSNYEEFLRGTRCVENQARVFIFFDETLVSGYVLSTSSQKMAQERNHVSFTFQLFVTSWATVSRLGDPTAQPLSDTRVKNRAEAAPFLPQKIQQIGNGYKVGSDGVVDMSQTIQDGFTLFESLATTALSAAKRAIATAQVAVQSSTASINNTLNGTVVRVPVGFAGALEFDDPFAPSQPSNFEGAVKFGVYADNADEYITAGGQYSSSVTANGVNQVEFENPSDQLQRDQKLVDRATQLWLENGLSPPTPGPVSSRLLSDGIGMFRLGASESWLKQKDQIARLADSVNQVRSQMNMPAGFGTAFGRHGGGA